jgi:hypothetical protein
VDGDNPDLRVRKTSRLGSQFSGWRHSTVTTPPFQTQFESRNFRSRRFSAASGLSQLVRAVGQVQQLDAFLNVGLVGALVRRDVAQEAVLLAAPLGRLAVEESGVDPSDEIAARQVRGR